MDLSAEIVICQRYIGGYQFFEGTVCFLLDEKVISEFDFECRGTLSCFFTRVNQVGGVIHKPLFYLANGKEYYGEGGTLAYECVQNIAWCGISLWLGTHQAIVKKERSFNYQYVAEGYTSCFSPSIGQRWVGLTDKYGIVFSALSNITGSVGFTVRAQTDLHHLNNEEINKVLDFLLKGPLA